MNLQGRVMGMPAWGVLLALGAAGVVGYLIFFRNQGASGGVGAIVPAFGDNTNPDYSASLGALENQVLESNRIATSVGEGQSQTLDYLSRMNSDLYNQITAQGTQQYNLGQAIYAQNQAGYSGLGATLNTLSGQHAA